MAQIDSYKYWMEQLVNRSASTRQNYAALFKPFLKWVGMTPDQLFEAAKAQRKESDEPRENQVLEAKVRAYLAYLRDSGKAVWTQAHSLVVIKSFFDCNQVPLRLSARDIPKGTGEGSRVPEKTEIIKLLNATKSQRYRCAILLAKDTGLRLSDLVRLTWSGVKDYGEGFWGWKIITQKQKIKAVCFAGPESTEALELLKRKYDRIFPLNAVSLSNALTDIIKAAKLEELSGHGLRKYFSTEMEAARVPREYRLRFMGKAVTVYDEERESKLFQVYREAYDNLRVLGASNHAEIENLKNSVEELRQENRKLHEAMESRREVDPQLDQLFADQKFLEIVKARLKDLKT
jgi:integrase